VLDLASNFETEAPDGADLLLNTCAEGLGSTVVDVKLLDWWR
jgi:hypothetical protein